MRIERNARDFGLQEGILAVDLTDAELEQAFRIRENQYLSEDIGSFIEEMHESGELSESQYQESKNRCGFREEVAKLYNKHCSCDIAYNDTIKEAIKDTLKCEEAGE